MKYIFTLLIRAYRSTISPILGQSCRFYPSCSQYALDSFEHYGALRALFMTIWRVLRCNPFSKGGFDPAVPEGCVHTHFNDHIVRSESSGE